jgi:CRISPR-associated protein Cmr3
LEAIAVQRPQVVSGWDLALKKPKPTRRLAPAGTVFFLSLEGTDEAIKSWISNIWMQCISDEEQASNDGFGLAVIGTWSGKPENMG